MRACLEARAWIMMDLPTQTASKKKRCGVGSSMCAHEMTCPLSLSFLLSMSPFSSPLFSRPLPPQAFSFSGLTDPRIRYEIPDQVTLHGCRLAQPLCGCLARDQHAMQGPGCCAPGGGAGMNVPSAAAAHSVITLHPSHRLYRSTQSTLTRLT